MSRFNIREEVIIKVQGEIRGRGKITRIFPGGRLYDLTLAQPDITGLSDIMALDNKLCCKYGFGNNSYQVYKLEEV